MVGLAYFAAVLSMIGDWFRVISKKTKEEVRADGTAGSPPGASLIADPEPAVRLNRPPEARDNRVQTAIPQRPVSRYMFRLTTSGCICPQITGGVDSLAVSGESGS